MVPSIFHGKRALLAKLGSKDGDPTTSIRRRAGCSASTSRWPLSLTMRWPRASAKPCSRIRCSRLPLAQLPEPSQPFCSTPLTSVLNVAFGEPQPSLFQTDTPDSRLLYVRRRARALGSPRGAVAPSRGFSRHPLRPQ